MRGHRLIVLAGLTFAAVHPVDAQQAPVPLTLRDAIAEALAASPDLQPAHDAVVAAGISERQAGAEFNLKITPALSTSAAAGLEQRQVGVTVTRLLPTGARVRAQADSWSAGLFHDRGYSVSFSQPLLRGFGATTTHALANARRGVESSERSLVEAGQQLVVNVAEAYFAVLRQERLVEATAHSRDRALTLQEASEKRAAVGLSTRLDVLRAELLAAQAEAALATQLEGLEATRDRLKLLLGRSLDDPLPLDPGVIETGGLAVPPGFEAPDGPVETLVGQALSARLEARESRDRIDDARRQASVVRWESLPPVSLEVGYTQRGLGLAYGQPLATAPGGWHVGFTMTNPLDRSAEEAAAAMASLAERAAVRAASDTAQRITADVRRLHRAWVRSAGTLAIHQQAVTVAERQLRLAELRYERGLADNFDVIDAESSLFGAQSALIAAEVERALAGLHLRRAIGAIDLNEFRR